MAEKYLKAEDVADAVLGVPKERQWMVSLVDVSCAIAEIPAADVVAANAFKQVVWERDIALGQLAEIGKGLGAKMDDVRPVVHAKWIVKQDDKCWWAECSNCGNEPGRDKYRNDWLSPFCPSCGAEMSVDEAAISRI